MSTSVASCNLQALQSFHYRCGRCITLSNSNRTAKRSVRDFSHALVFSAEPLVDDILFEVVIEKKNHSWGGSIEIGVTSEAPDKLELASCATAMRNGTWVMSGIDVRKDGLCLIEFYGTDLETLNETDRVGVMRTSNNELVFYVNGESQGVAAVNMPKTLWALVDLYGRCVQVSLCPTDATQRSMIDSPLQSQQQQIVQNIDVPMCVDVSVVATTSQASLDVNTSGNKTSNTSLNSLSFPTLGNISGTSGLNSAHATNGTDVFDMNDRLCFHTRCGSLVKLLPSRRSAERRRPLDEFNNGVVMTHRPLRDNELFEIRIDKLVDKWSGSIEVGVTTHNPTVLHFPATMTNMRSGTIMMSGCGILTNGKGTRRQYGEFNLDELREGDRVGMMRKANGNLHYYINGQDQGIAATRVAAILWGVIDLYGMTIKVTIVNRDEREQQNLVTRRNNLLANGGVTNATHSATPVLSLLSPDSDAAQAGAAAAAVAAFSDDQMVNGRSISRNDDRLTFHQMCGSHATVTHSGRTALRPNASDDFNNGVVLTRRPLRSNEMFQVRLERVVTKWAGSVEMGVTTHSAEDLEFPFTMTNVRTGTWMMTGNGVMHNGITVIEQYGQNLDRLQVGDRVGVVRKDDGTLHFWVNGIDQGQAASNVPERVFGVIDLYGQAAQASIIDTSECGSPDTGNSTISNTTLYSEIPLRFHSIHGANAGISNGGLTASRPNSLAEFNDAIVFSNRPLRQRELFEVELQTMVRHWSGNIEIGVTGTRPEDIQLAPNATDLDANDTIILCGPMIFHNRKTIRTNVLIDLDTLGVGTRAGVMRNGDFIHFYIDGVDQGPACECNVPNIWAIIDLYGQCAQVSITQNPLDIRAPYATSENSQSCQATSVIQPATLETKHRWACFAGNATLSEDLTLASRVSSGSQALSQCVIFSEHPLSVGAPFELKISTFNSLFAGCLNIGITDLNLSDENVRKKLPLSIKRIPANVWYVSGNEIRFNNQFMHRALASLEWLRVDDRISLELTPARTLRILLNSEDININFHNVPNDVYVVAELQGSTIGVQVISSQGPTSPLRPYSLRLQDSLDFGVDPLNKQDSMLESMDSEAQNCEFSELCGKNIRLSDERRTATRLKSYNQALVYLTKPLCKGESISIKIDGINSKWKGTIGVGVVGACPQPPTTASQSFPPSIINLKRTCWVATHDYININGQIITSKYGEALEQIQVGTVITLTLTHAGMLIIMVGSTNLEDLATGLPNHIYPVFDVYGKCEKISIITGSDAARNGTPIIEAPEAILLELDNGLPQQCEKANLEVHEKETDQTLAMAASIACMPSTSNSMNRSVMESVSENLLLNISIKNRTLEQSRAEAGSSSSICCLRESLQLQHNTNLNIQRSQSTQRFQNAMNSSAGACSLSNIAGTSGACGSSIVHDTNKDYDALEEATLDTGNDNIHDYNDGNNLSLINGVCGSATVIDLSEDANSIEMNAGATGSNVLAHDSNVVDEDIIDDNDDLDDDIDQMNHLLLLQQLQQNEYTRMQQHILRAQISSMTLDFSSLQSGASETSLNSTSSVTQMEAMMSITSMDRNPCEYLKLVTRFCSSLVLPHAFFHRRLEPICFCAQCIGSHSDKLEGWVYFKLNRQAVNSTAAPGAQLVFDTGDWLPFYYMTRVDKIRAILDRGQPLPLESNSDTSSVSSHQKDEPGTRLELYYSPNANGIEDINAQHNYVAKGESYSIGTAFEVYVRRQSICAANSKTNLAHNVVAAAICAERRMSCVENASTSAQSTDCSGDGAHSSTSATSIVSSSMEILKDMSWFTKEAGACVINALILKLDKIPSNEVFANESNSDCSI